MSPLKYLCFQLDRNARYNLNNSPVILLCKQATAVCSTGSRADTHGAEGYVSRLPSSYSVGTSAGVGKTTKHAASSGSRRTSYDSSGTELSHWTSTASSLGKLRTPDAASRSQMAEQKHIMRQVSLTDSGSRRTSRSNSVERSRPSTSKPLTRTQSNSSTTQRSVQRSSSLDAYKSKPGSRSASPTSPGVTSAIKPQTIAAYKPASFGRSSLSAATGGLTADQRSDRLSSSALGSKSKVTSSSSHREPVEGYAALLQRQQQQKRSQSLSGFLDRVQSPGTASVTATDLQRTASSVSASALYPGNSLGLYPVSSSSGFNDRYMRCPTYMCTACSRHAICSLFCFCDFDSNTPRVDFEQCRLQASNPEILGTASLLVQSKRSTPAALPVCKWHAASHFVWILHSLCSTTPT